MPSLKKAVFVCLDVESTGLDPEHDRVIEIAAIAFTMDSVIGEYESLVDPSREIPMASQAIHNISDAMVQGQPKIADVLPKLLPLTQDRIIVGHGIQFDIDILTKEAARAGLACSLASQEFIDTLRLARLYGESPSNSLDVLRQHFNIQAEGAHRAMGDVVVNIQVFCKLCSRFNTTEQIKLVLSRPIQMKTMPLGKHKGRPFKELPSDYLYWAVKQDFDKDLSFSIRTELQRRKKGGSFGEAANPFKSMFSEVHL